MVVFWCFFCVFLMPGWEHFGLLLAPKSEKMSLFSHHIFQHILYHFWSPKWSQNDPKLIQNTHKNLPQNREGFFKQQKSNCYHIFVPPDYTIWGFRCRGVSKITCSSFPTISLLFSKQYPKKTQNLIPDFIQIQFQKWSKKGINFSYF